MAITFFHYYFTLQHKNGIEFIQKNEKIKMQNEKEIDSLESEQYVYLIVKVEIEHNFIAVP